MFSFGLYSGLLYSAFLALLAFTSLFALLALSFAFGFGQVFSFGFSAEHWALEKTLGFTPSFFTSTIPLASYSVLGEYSALGFLISLGFSF